MRLFGCAEKYTLRTAHSAMVIIINFSFLYYLFSQTNNPIVRILGQQLSPQLEQLAALARWKQRKLTHGFATSLGEMTNVELGFAIFLMKVALEEPRLLV